MKSQRISERPKGDDRKRRFEKPKVKHLAITLFLFIGLIITSANLGKLYPYNIVNPINTKSHQLEGLWAYESLKPGSIDKEFQITGYFIFHDGYFVQHSINDGEPFEDQSGMAHAGPYRKANKEYHITAEIGISVSPTRTPPLSVRLGRQHKIFPEFSGEKLFLTFGSGTVQNFHRIETEQRKIYKLDKGYLAIADNYFIFVSAWENNSIAGSGTFKKEGNTMKLNTERWFSVAEGKVEYLKNQKIAASFDGKTLSLPDGVVFHCVKKNS